MSQCFSELKVAGMSCPRCEAKIKKYLEEIQGVESVGASAEKGLVSVHYDDQEVDLQVISDTIEGIDDKKFMVINS